MISFKEVCKIGILGRGFGLYGYLPAVVNNFNATVFLPETYRSEFLNRSELKVFSNRIRWVTSEEIVQQNVDMLIIARRPQDNGSIIASLFKQHTAPVLVFEKPLGPSPIDALNLLEEVRHRKWHLKVGFTFRWAPWASRWKSWISNAAHPTGLANLDAFRLYPCRVRWSFMANHYKHGLINWKRSHADGGGALRFYGIHLITLLAEWGYSQIVKSRLVVESDGGAPVWHAVLRGPLLRDIVIDLDSRSTENIFEIQCDETNTPIHRALDPFDEVLPTRQWSNTDRRCSYLSAMLDENLPPDLLVERFFSATMLWQEIEDQTDFEINR